MTGVWKPRALLVVAAVAGAAALGVRAAAEEPASAPAASAPAGENSNISAEAVELGRNERIALGAVRDGNHSLEETAFYMLLANIAKRPALSVQEVRRLARPTVKSLLTHPEAYRAQAVELTLHVAKVKKLSPGDGLSHTLDWPSGRPVWRLDCLNAAAQYPGDEPVVVMSVVEPTLLPKPDRVEDDGDSLYFGLGPGLQVVGVFYKVYQAQTTGDQRVAAGAWRNYPVILAWQLAPAGAGQVAAPERHGSIATTAPPLLLAVVVLLAGYIFLRRMTHRRRESAPRDPPRGAPPRRGEQGAAVPDGQDEVDPLLKEASREYRKKRLGEDDQVDPG